MICPLRNLLLVCCLVGTSASGQAQFMDYFDGSKIDGWFTMTGDGAARMTLQPEQGFARILVDATQDRHNVWWALIKRDVTAHLDLAKLKDPGFELRVEARVRPSHAPRRVNFMINTQRTTDFHQHLREFDLEDTTKWYTISMTTKEFDAGPGDTVYVQLAATDWGTENYYLDVDYYRADVVRRDSAGPDLGEPLVYHPPVAAPASFAHHAKAAHDSMINTQYPDVNFNDWHAGDPAAPERVLTVNAGQSIILRWDLGSYRDNKAGGAALLELTTHSVAQGGNYVKAYGNDLGIEFGKIRVIEILGGESAWDQTTVTYQQLLQGRSETEVFNSQMISDIEVAPRPGSKTFVTLPRPVMQRLLDGRTKGLVIRPLGAITASFYASECERGRGPILHFDTAR